MSLEKPISTIRKAVAEVAQRSAEEEFLNSPEQQHYQEALHTYRLWRALDPDTLEIGIKINAQEHDFRNTMGPELYKVFNSIWTDVTEDSKQGFENAEKKIKRIKFLRSAKSIEADLEQLDDKFMTDKVKQLKNNPMLLQAFSGKEGLLFDAIESSATLMREYMKLNRESARKWQL